MRTLHAALFLTPSLVCTLLLPNFATPTRDEQAARAPRNVAIFVYPGVELLDFAGPGEVFASASTQEGEAFRVYTVAKSKAPLTSQGFVTITPQYSIEDCPKPDIVVVPGGNVPSNDATLREWVRARSQEAEIMMSVCNGAMLYASAGLLKGLEVTTHHSALQGVALLEPEARVFTNRRFVDNGHVITAAGVAAGIDGALHVVERLCGQDVAWRTARYMEYDWRPDEIAKLHAQPGILVDGAEAMTLIGSVRRLGLEGAAAELKKLAQPPTEEQLNRWGYTLLYEGKHAEALDLFRLVSVAFPTSANAMDSLGEALEARSDHAAAKEASQACLDRLEKDKGLADDRRKILRNAASSRLARLSGANASALKWVCPPCDNPCDKVGYLEGGRCPGCIMQLVERSR